MTRAQPRVTQALGGSFGENWGNVHNVDNWAMRGVQAHSAIGEEHVLGHTTRVFAD